MNKAVTRFMSLPIQTLPKSAVACAFSLMFLLAGCGGGTGTGNPGNVTLASAPLAGPNAASFDLKTFLFNHLMDALLGAQQAFAAVSNFKTFQICNDTFVMTDVNGNSVPLNGQSTEAGLGLLTFSPTATTPMSLVSMNVAAGVQIKEIDVTTAVKPGVCGGVTFAVLFDPGSGPIPITQNTAFKFQFASPMTITSAPQTLDLLFGQIVNGMVGLGAGLNNSTIQTVNVGQAK